MKLEAKKSAKINVKSLKALMAWSSGIDFDLMALSKTKSRGDVLTYFGNKGSLSESPYIQVGEDKGVGDTEGANEEELVVDKIDDDVEQTLIICMDYNKAKAGEVARFAESDIKLTVSNDNDTFVVVPQIDKSANACCLVRIVNTPEGPELVHDGRMGVLKKFSDSNDIVEAFPFI